MTPGEERSTGDEKTAELSSARSGDTGSARPDQPKRIGPYAIRSVLGQGGMGIVYLGSRDDGQFTQRAAIKVIKRGFDTDEVLKRFEIERQVLSALNHPNIARVYDGGMTEDGLPYFAMEYIEGTTLVEYCDRNRLTTRERLVLFRKICDAVQYAHQNLVVHRDLKPTNIIVTGGGEPKLLDFGIAKLLNAPLFQAQAVTGTVMRLMTPEYASPEQVRGDPVGTPSDVYSLGVLLYELLTGRRPYSFSSRIEQEIVRVVCEVDPERPSTAATHAASVMKDDGSTEEISAETFAKVREGEPSRLRRMLRGDVDLIVLKSLEKTPKRRYQTAEQLSDDIVRYLSGMPIEARPPSVAYKASKFVRRNKAAVIAAALVLVSVVAGVSGVTWQWQRAEAALAVAETERHRAEEERVRAEDAAAQAIAAREVAESLSESLIRELPSLLNPYAGTIDARRLTSTLALNALNGINELSEGDDPRRKKLIAQTYTAYAQTLSGARQTNTGDSGEAIEMHRQAIAIYEELLASAPDDERARFLLAESRIYLADLAYLQGRLRDAQASYEDAIEALDALEITDATIGRVFVRRAGAAEGVAKVALRLGDAETALEARRKNLEFRIRTYNALPDSIPESTRSTVWRNVSSGHTDVADTLALLGRYDEALDLYASAIEIRASLLSDSPESARARRDLAYTLARRALVAIRGESERRFTEDTERAVALMREVFEENLQSERPDRRNNLYLSQILNARSMTLRIAGEPETSPADEALELAQGYIDNDPSNTVAVHTAIAAELERARVRRAMGEPREALGAARAAEERCRELRTSLTEPDREADLLLVESLLLKAELLVSASSSVDEVDPDAVADLREARRLAERLRGQGPLPAYLERMLAALSGP
ncbi:MAG: serine/threonine-protein kinase [Phycisphaerales bacterium]